VQIDGGRLAVGVLLGCFVKFSSVPDGAFLLRKVFFLVFPG